MADIKNYPPFYLRKEGVQVEVLEWLGDLKPYGELQEVWVQINGIPPRWCHWKVFAQIVSGFGLMTEVDWSALFKSFYETTRVKVACKDYTKISNQRLFEMNKELHVVVFTVEAEQEKTQADKGNDGGDGGDDDLGDDGEEDDLLDDTPTKEQTHHTQGHLLAPLSRKLIQVIIMVNMGKRQWVWT